MTQISFFDGVNKWHNTKPIRLIECFAGYGSQALALKYLGIPFEHHKICEWAIKSIQAYKDLHFPNDDTDYSASLTSEEIIEYLLQKQVSADYNTPMTLPQIKRMGEHKRRTIYNNIQATHNLCSITNVKADDLNIKDTHLLTYLLTYSFPCQDLSNQGLKMGMKKGSGTRSGLLWEIERILHESKELPQILLMENVPEVTRGDNLKSFFKWCQSLESLGYKNYWKILNGTEYSIPQSRKRCFMVSILGDYFFDFPMPCGCNFPLRILLSEKVPESFIVKGATLEYYKRNDKLQKSIHFRMNDVNDAARTITTREAMCMTGNFIKCDCKARLVGDKYSKMLESNRRCYSIDGSSPTLTTFGGGNQEVKILLDDEYCRVLTPKECFRLMGVRDIDFDKIAKNQSRSSLYHLAGDSIITNCLMAIFGELFEVDWRSKIQELVKTIKSNNE